MTRPASDDRRPASPSGSKASPGGLIRSMTGQGIAAGPVWTVELRTVNHRGLKFSLRTHDSITPIEPKIERTIRNRLHRGSVSVSVRRQSAAATGLTIDTEVLQRYVTQWQMVADQMGLSAEVDLAAAMTLPGVLQKDAADEDPESLWATIEPILDSAVSDLDQMRMAEGESMAASLRNDCGQIKRHVDKIAEIAPRAAENYSERLETKIQRVLERRGVETSPVDLIREVQIYADRADVSEEITRLGSHLQMFADVLSSGKAIGRKLEFILQEMSRETNTIGSKAADTDISAQVVDIKCAIERMRELIQNLE